MLPGVPEGVSRVGPIKYLRECKPPSQSRMFVCDRELLRKYLKYIVF